MGVLRGAAVSLSSPLLKSIDDISYSICIVDLGPVWHSATIGVCFRTRISSILLPDAPSLCGFRPSLETLV